MPPSLPVASEDDAASLEEAAEPQHKKSKTEKDNVVFSGTVESDNKEDADDDEDLCGTAWAMFSTYLQNCDGSGDDDSDGNEEDKKDDSMAPLKDLCDLLEDEAQRTGILPSPKPLEIDKVQTVQELLPLLLSVAYCFRAEHSVSQYMDLLTANSGDKKDSNPDLPMLLKTCQTYLTKSLSYFSQNAAARSMAANLGRVTRTLDDADCFGYMLAADHAKQVRRQALLAVERADLSDGVKEWIEVLVLNQIAGVQYEDDDDDDEVDDENINSNEKEDDDNAEGFFSASNVEETARYMAAMLLSRKGRHAEALAQLRCFPSLTHRIHPHVWDGRAISKENSNIMTPDTNAITETMAPVSFQGGVLPPKLYQRMCEVFAPSAAFWKETDYANRGYFSFFRNIGKSSNSDSTKTDKYWQPSDLIDDVVMNHLLPLVQDALSKRKQENSRKAGVETICAYEWWTHSRSNEANLGHMLHFDTDEADLEGKQEQKDGMHHPIISSVLHITGDSRTSGATIMLDQTPESLHAAPTCWQSIPQENTYMIFPGNLLHGVLPCPGREPAAAQSAAQSSSTSGTPPEDPTSSVPRWLTSPPSVASNDKHRLTFMVGWKTRHVPDQRKDRDSLYGPCAPLPPKEVASWVREILLGYDGENGSMASMEPRQPYGTGSGSIRMEPLPSVSPGWEEIPHPPVPVKESDIKNKAQLKLPSPLDRRFFASEVPSCFLESLFEDDDT